MAAHRLFFILAATLAAPLAWPTLAQTNGQPENGFNPGIHVHRGQSAEPAMTAALRIDPAGYDFPTLIVRGSVREAPSTEAGPQAPVVIVNNRIRTGYRYWYGTPIVTFRDHWLGNPLDPGNWYGWTREARTKRARAYRLY